jgi:hypothetical protein
MTLVRRLETLELTGDGNPKYLRPVQIRDPSISAPDVHLVRLQKPKAHER